jgi:hypothetical protein
MSRDRRVARGARERDVTDVLPRLKREGCNLLVTGSVSAETANRATQRLLGAPEVERKRVLVRTHGTAPVTDLLPVGVTPNDPTVRVFDYGNYDAESESLRTLGRDVSNAIDEFRSGPTSLVGGELRLSVVSLGPLLVDNDVPSTERFLRRTTQAVADARGMGHYRYPGPRSEFGARSFDPDHLFDGILSLRERVGPEQRLSIPATVPTVPTNSTDWVEL